MCHARLQWVLDIGAASGSSHPSVFAALVDWGQMLLWPKLLLIMKVLELGYIQFEGYGRGRQHHTHLQWGDSPKYFDGRLSRPKSYFVVLLDAERVWELMPFRHQRFPYILHWSTDLYYRSLLRAEDTAAVEKVLNIVEAGMNHQEEQQRSKIQFLKETIPKSFFERLI